MGVVAQDSMEGVMRAEPFISATSWWHIFPIKVAFTTAKDTNIKLSLKGTEIEYL